jgi:hypothetical protein
MTAKAIVGAFAASLIECRFFDTFYLAVAFYPINCACLNRAAIELSEISSRLCGIPRMGIPAM